VLHAYIHFEALTNHDYMYSCINCGYYPKVVIMDLHKKGEFSVPCKLLYCTAPRNYIFMLVYLMNSICVFSVSEIKSPPDDFEGHTNIVSFWELVTQEMVGRGFLQSKLLFSLLLWWIHCFCY